MNSKTTEKRDVDVRLNYTIKSEYLGSTFLTLKKKTINGIRSSRIGLL